MGYEKYGFSTNIWLYIGNDTRYTWSGRWIATLMWCHFQSMVPFSVPWTNTNPHFKGTPLFDIEYLRNGTRWRHSYSGILIGSYAVLSSIIGLIFSGIEWRQNCQQYGALRGLVTTAELLVTLAVVNCHCCHANTLCSSWVSCFILSRCCQQPQLSVPENCGKIYC